MSETSRIGTGWQRALMALMALWLVVLFVYRDTAIAMATIWEQSETFAHAWVVPPISAWLGWRLRGQVLALEPKPAPWVLLPMAVIGLLWLAGELVAVATATQFALVALLVFAVPAMLGIPVARVLAFPLGFLFFCVPAGEFLVPTLMHWTAEFTIAALRATGIPVYQEGLMFVIPTGTWSVVQACSGIRYLIASLMVGTLFAYLNYNSMRRRWIFVGISIVVPLVANWLRAYMIVMLGHLSGNKLAVGADHLLYGWVLFGIIIVGLYWIGSRWTEPMVDSRSGAPSMSSWPSWQGGLVAVAAVALVAAPIWLYQRLDAAGGDAPVLLVLPDELPGGWQRADDPAPRWQPGFRNPVTAARAAYRNADGGAVGVYIGYYRQQDEHRKLVSSANRMVAEEPALWNVLSVASRAVNLQGSAFQVREGQLLQTEVPGMVRQQLKVWQTYWIDGQYVAGDIAGKLRGAWSRLRGQGDDSAVLLLYVDDAEKDMADGRLSQFLVQALPALEAVMAAPRRVAQGE